jgi:uncharacterized repeat protein (TIGR01451 family)
MRAVTDRWAPRRVGERLITCIAALAAVLVLAPTAFANGTVGSFEVDGNLVDSPAGEPIDWSTPPPNLTTFTDATGRNDDSFNLGSKETDPAGWQCITGSAPQKDDILNGQVAFRTINGKQYAYVNFTRKGVNGDAHIDYEFSQSTLPNPSCPALPQRTNGDIIITFDTNNGGATITVSAYKWVGTATLGTLQQLPVGSEHVTWDGAVNIPNSIPGHTAGDFGEASLNLTDTIGTISCGQFSRAYMKSRSSTSIDAALQDRTAPRAIQVGDCPNSSLAKAVRDVTKNGTFATSTTASPGDTIEYQLTYKNTGSVPATDVNISDTIQPHQTFLSCTGGCTTNGPPVTTVNWHFDSVGAGQTVVVTFQVKLDSTFPNGTTTIRNVSTVTTHEEGQKTSNETTVTVSSAPKSQLVKAVRDVTTSGTFGTSTTASPGDTIEYQLTYTNTGTSTATNVTISDPIPAKTTFVSCSQNPPCTTTGTPVTSVSWTFASVAPGQTVVVTFRVKLDSTGWPAGTTTAVTNVGTVCTAEEPSCSNSNQTTVNVQTPSSSLAKAVRNVTSGGSFSTSTTAKPGDVIEYRLTYTNAGPGTAHNVVISDPIPAHTTFVSCSQTPPCTTDGPPVTKVTWNIGDVAAGQTVVVTFQVKLDSVFPAGTTTITNVGTVCTDEEGCKNSPPTTVTVTANPNLGLHKEASLTGIAVPGDQITYTLTYSNTGDADAKNVVITEDIPAGTEFVSCSDNCTTDGPPVTKVTWSIGTVPAGGSGSVTLTIRVLNSVGCSICNVAHIASPDQNGGAQVNSNQVCLDSTPGPNPAGAHANGSAYAAHVEEGILGINQTISPVSSSQSGVGSSGQSDSALSPRVPSDGSLLSADVLRADSRSTVTNTPAQAEQVSSGEAANVKVLRAATGVYAVTADVVDSVATAKATGDGSSFSSAGSTIANLHVNGVLVNDIKPGLRIDLPAATYGNGAYVVIDDEHGSTSGPDVSKTLSGGTYAADLTVDMIHVHVDDVNLLKGGNQPLDVVVGHAVAHADFPQTRLCAALPVQEVSGHAFIASETTDPLLAPLTVGFVSIPASGGSDSQHLDSAALPDDGSVVTAAVSDSSSTGTRGISSSTASSYAQAANVCVKLRGANGGCTIGATAVKSQSNSSADALSRSSNDTGTQLVGVVVNGTPFAGTPPPNTTIPIPGLATVILNEQTCDNGGTLANHCSDGTQAGHSGLTVRAIHVILLDPAPGGNPGADVKVAEAHSDATYR